MKTSLLALTFASLTACGVNSASVGAPPDGDLEADTASGELTANSANLLFSMRDGNTWTLVGPSGAVRTVRYSNVADNVGQIDGLFAEGGWLGTSSTASSTLYAWSQSASDWKTFIRFGSATNQWTWGAGACNAYDVRRSATDVSIATPAGTFTQARTIAFDRQPSPTARCQPPAFTELTFAPGVGLVALNTYDGQFLLQSANVNGNVFPAPSNIKGSLRLDKATYTNKPNTIVCITAPCPSNAVTAAAKATYTVTNKGTKSETWQFTSGCQFNLRWVDDTGRTVRSLSDTRACTLALTSLTLAPGQSKTFAAELPLANRDEEQLFGSFTGVAALTSKSVTPNGEATAAFVVKKP